MNNNNFSLLRYFIDLGYDAKLILLENEFDGKSSHFEPICDTWEIEKWEKYIVTAKISDHPVSVFCYPLSFFLFIYYLLKNIKFKDSGLYFPITNYKIKSIFSEYNVLIGSGTSPSFLNRINRSLTIFYPYSGGVEWVGEPVIQKKINSNNIIERLIIKKIISNQVNGIRKAKFVVSPDAFTQKTYQKYNIDAKYLMCPLIYNQGLITSEKPNDKLEIISSLISNSDLSFLSHSRHLWKHPDTHDENEWKFFDKNNDWYIRAFSRLIKLKYVSKPILIMFEYGDDVLYSKKLCSDLGINEFVVWLPKSNRKEIMWIISKVDICFGEFYDIPDLLFGGTGFEVLCCGKPLIQGFNFKEEDFEKNYNIPAPPVLRVINEIDIFNHLVNLVNNPQLRKQYGDDSKIWFNKYCGIGLAKRWIDIIFDIN
jgi:hypothetical protein